MQMPVAYLASTDADVDTFIASSSRPSIADAPVPAAPVVKREVFASSFTGLTTSPGAPEGGRIKASPAARRIASDRGI